MLKIIKIEVYRPGQVWTEAKDDRKYLGMFYQAAPTVYRESNGP